MTFAELKDSIRRQVWASGEPEALIQSHDLHFQEVLALIAKWVDGEKVQNISTFEFCKTNYRCGMTVVPAPRGVISRVWTVCDWCDPVFYYPTEWPQPECEGQCVMRFQGLTSSGKALPLGFQEADSSTDSTCGRARRGIWAQFRNNLYLAPYIQSTEMVVVEWDGIKTQWEDTDPVNDDQDYRATVKLFWQAFHERDHGDPQKALTFHNPMAMRRPELGGSADLALAELIWYDRERTKTRQDKGGCAAFPGWTKENRLISSFVDTCALPATPGPLIVAHIGNFGSGNAHEALVAAVVAAMGPTAVLASAPNAYNSDSASQNYDDEVGKGYHQFISPYVGAQGEGASKNAFWPSPGTVDWSHDGDLSTYLSFFALPNNGRYYDICLGPIHLFVLDAVASETDGATETSAQGQWLKAKLWLARNEPTWKIVLMGDEVPYSTLGSTTDRRWSYRSWGADMVLSGLGNYERVLKQGLNYINNGSGGRTLQTTGSAAIDGRQYYDQTNYGAGRLVATRCSLRYEFIDVAGLILDSVQLTRPKLGECAEAVQAATLESGSIMNFLPPVSEQNQTQQQFFSHGGDPNGVITPTGPLPCLLWDTTNSIYWVKDDGLITNTGWH